MKRNFDDIVNSLKDSIATYDYFVDFEKVYRHIDEVKVELNILNSLIGEDNIEEAFSKLLIEYPKVLGVIPILLAIRKGEISIIDGEIIIYSFKNINRDIKDYVKLLKESGLEELIRTKKIKNLVDYVIGVEVGLDTNARKNRTGTLMEAIVESYIKKIPNVEYIKQATKIHIKERFNINVLENLVLDEKNGETNKRFDFAVKSKSGKVLLIETNFYSGGGSKLNETARSYAKLANDMKNINEVEFVWITDGIGWKSTKNNLREAYQVINHLYTIEDLNSGVLEKI